MDSFGFFFNRRQTGKVTAGANDGIEFVQNLCDALKVPSLSEFGLKKQDFPLIVDKSYKSSSMKGNPITLTENELLEILEKSI